MTWGTRTSFFAVVLAASVCSSSLAISPGHARADSKPMVASPDGEWLTEHGCHVDFGALGLVEKTFRDEIDLKQIQLEKKIVRIEAELELLRMDYQRTIKARDFDLTATQKIFGSMSVKDSEIRVAHTTFLHDVAGLLNDEQWTMTLNQVEESGCGPLARP